MIYTKINDEIEEIEEEIEDFEKLNLKIEEQIKLKEKVEENGYSPVPGEENKEMDSPNNAMIEGVKEMAEDVELE